MVSAISIAMAIWPTRVLRHFFAMPAIGMREKRVPVTWISFINFSQPKGSNLPFSLAKDSLAFGIWPTTATGSPLHSAMRIQDGLITGSISLAMKSASLGLIGTAPQFSDHASLYSSSSRLNDETQDR